MKLVSNHISGIQTLAIAEALCLAESLEFMAGPPPDGGEIAYPHPTRTQRPEHRQWTNSRKRS